MLYIYIYIYHILLCDTAIYNLYRSCDAAPDANESAGPMKHSNNL